MGTDFCCNVVISYFAEQKYKIYAEFFECVPVRDLFKHLVEKEFGFGFNVDDLDISEISSGDGFLYFTNRKTGARCVLSNDFAESSNSFNLFIKDLLPGLGEINGYISVKEKSC